MVFFRVFTIPFPDTATYCSSKASRWSGYRGSLSANCAPDSDGKYSTTVTSENIYMLGILFLETQMSQLMCDSYREISITSSGRPIIKMNK